MSYYELAKEQRERGKAGLNRGIPITLPKLKKYIPNIQKGKYYLVAMDSGIGKTKLVNFLFVYTPFFQYIKSNGQFDIDINYYTGEMPVEEIIAEFQTFWLYITYNKLEDMDSIYSLGDNTIPKDVDELLDSKECQDITDEFEKKVRIVNEHFNRKYIYKELMSSANKHGIVEWTGDNDNRFIKSYKEKNPNLYNINI